MGLNRIFHTPSYFVMTVAGFIASPLLLIIRLYLGFGFFLEGAEIITNLSGASSAFRSLPFPMVFAFIKGVVFCMGALMLLIGYHARLAAFVIGIFLFWFLIQMHSNVFTAMLSSPRRVIEDMTFISFFASLVILCFGSGRYSWEDGGGSVY